MTSTLTNLIYHVVFSTKNRAPTIKEEIQTELYDYIAGIIRNKQELLLGIGGIENHLHLILKVRAGINLSEMVRVIKANSSKWLNERKNYQGSFSWQNGYGAFTVSASQIERVRHYVRNQKEHHRKNSFEEEYLIFLKQNQIEYNPTYLWG
ncbi:MAG: IS200/IS605 family transposase [Myxococcaceae bacterium]